MKIGCRILPSSVHSANFTSHTRAGWIHCTGSLVFIVVENGDFLVLSGCIASYNCFRLLWSKPPPACPTYFRWPPSYRPTTTAPKYSRDPRGSVYPPMTTSCRCIVLTFNQSFDRF